MNLYEEIQKIKASGYSEQNAQAKLGQDIVLKAIADSGMAQTGNSRRYKVQIYLPFTKRKKRNNEKIRRID